MRQALLVPGARALRGRGRRAVGALTRASCRMRVGPSPPRGWFYLNIFREAVEHLLGHRHGLGKVPFALLLDDVLARIVPVEVADGFLGSWGR